jgi:hypothetical protein
MANAFFAITFVEDGGKLSSSFGSLHFSVVKPAWLFLDSTYRDYFFGDLYFFYFNSFLLACIFLQIWRVPSTFGD